MRVPFILLFHLDNTLDVTFVLFYKYFHVHSHFLKDLKIIRNHLTITSLLLLLLFIENNISPSTVQQLGNLLASLPLPSLRSLFINERLWDSGIACLFSPNSLPKLINLEHLILCGKNLHFI